VVVRRSRPPRWLRRFLRRPLDPGAWPKSADALRSRAPIRPPPEAGCGIRTAWDLQLAVIGGDGPSFVGSADRVFYRPAGWPAALGLRTARSSIGALLATGRVYFGSGRRLYARDARTGRAVGRTPLPASSTGPHQLVRGQRRISAMARCRATTISASRLAGRRSSALRLQNARPDLGAARVTQRAARWWPPQLLLVARRLGLTADAGRAGWLRSTAAWSRARC